PLPTIRSRRGSPAAVARLSLSRQEATVAAVGIVGGRLELTLCATPILAVAPIEAAALHVDLVRTSGDVFHRYDDERRRCRPPDHHLLLLNRPTPAATAPRVRPPRAPPTSVSVRFGPWNMRCGFDVVRVTPPC